jgi:hypothetical protein
MPEEYAYHRLEHIGNLKSYRYEFMLPYFPTKSHIFTACFEPHEAVIGNGGLERIIKLLKWLPPTINAALLVSVHCTDEEMAKFNEVIPTFKYDQLLDETLKTLPEHTSWDKHADKFVCMNGTATKYNRYRLIVEMDKRNVLKDCVHSIMVLEENREMALRYLEEEDKEKYAGEEFLKYNNNPDKTLWNLKELGGPNNPMPRLSHGHIINSDIMEHKLFKLITESGWHTENEKDLCKFITEKTWYAIGFRLPFLIAGQYGSCEYLRELGFNTFDEFLIKPYDKILDSKERMDAIIDNAEYWVENLATMDGVAEAVEHNYNVLVKLGEENDKMLEHVFVNILHTPFTPDALLKLPLVWSDVSLARIRQTEPISGTISSSPAKDRSVS